MFELPELFGSPYVLPAIIVVVVLLLLILLLRLSRRRRAQGDRAGAPVRRTATRPGPVITGAAAVKGDGAVRAASEGSARGVATPARSTGAVLTSDTDPVATLIEDLLQGWGDITAEDTNRLKIFRADKVAAAIAAAEVPRSLKNSERAHTRLNQLRHYASSLQPAAGAGASMPLAVEETAGEERAAETSWGVEKDEAVADVADTVSNAPDAGSTAKLSWYGAPLPDKAADRTSKALVSTGPPEGIESSESLAEEQPQAIEFLSEEQPELVQEAAPEIVEEELPAEVELPAVDEAAEPEEAADADSFFSDFGAMVTTADELLRLPSDEQAGMLAFLNPGELGKVFQQAGDPELKKSVIDTLEHVGNTTALDVIHDCLDDPDPDIQVYALDAADRLLGVEQ